MMELNEWFVLELYWDAKNIPVSNWTIIVTPNKDPQFHIYEIETGVGSEFKVLLIIVTLGWIFIKLFFIYLNIIVTKRFL